MGRWRGWRFEPLATAVPGIEEMRAEWASSTG